MPFASKEDKKEWNKKWREQNRDKINADARARYKKNHEQELERKKRYYEIHKKEIAIKNKEWKDKYRDEINARERERYWRKKEEKIAILINISKNKGQSSSSKSQKM